MSTQPLLYTGQYAVLVISQDNAGSVCMSKASNTRDEVQKAAYDSKIKALEDQVSYFLFSFHSQGALDHSQYRRERAVSIDGKGNGYVSGSELFRSFFCPLVSLKYFQRLRLNSVSKGVVGIFLTYGHTPPAGMRLHICTSLQSHSPQTCCSDIHTDHVPLARTQAQKLRHINDNLRNEVFFWTQRDTRIAENMGFVSAEELQAAMSARPEAFRKDFVEGSARTIEGLEERVREHIRLDAASAAGLADAAKEIDRLKAENARLQERADAVAGERDAVARERDELKRRVEELEGALAGRAVPEDTGTGLLTPATTKKRYASPRLPHAHIC